MTGAADVVGHWLGLCRKAPVFPAVQEARGNPLEFTHEGFPDGGSGGPGVIRRGIGSALSGMKTLDRNRQLLLFALLAGLVMAGTTISQGVLWYIGWTMADAFVLHQVLAFFIEFVTVFCMVFILAGLILSIAPEKRETASFIEGLNGTKKNLSPLIVWSLLLAIAGMILNRILFYPGGLFWPFSIDAISVLAQYPFTLHLNPATFAEVPGYGGRSVLFWTYPYGVETALEFFVINLLLVTLTAFVVPLIVLEHKTVREAVTGSVCLMKKTWAETAACAIFLGVIVYGVFLTYLLVQAAHGMATPPELLYDRPTAPWLAAGILYYFVLASVAFVAATVGGIAVLELFRYAGTKEGTS